MFCCVCFLILIIIIVVVIIMWGSGVQNLIWHFEVGVLQKLVVTTSIGHFLCSFLG